MGKNRKSTKHRKTRGFLATRGGRRQGARPLSPTERRETPYGNATARGPLAGLRAAAPAADPGRPKFSGTTRSVKKSWSTKSERVRGFADCVAASRPSTSCMAA